MTSPAATLVHSTVSAVPELGPLLEEHLADYDGQVLPHIFFGEVSAWTVAHLGDEQAAVSRLLAHLETAYDGGAQDVLEVIALSFLDRFPERLVAQLGPRLRSELATQLG